MKVRVKEVEGVTHALNDLLDSGHDGLDQGDLACVQDIAALARVPTASSSALHSRVSLTLGSPLQLP